VGLVSQAARDGVDLQPRARRRHRFSLRVSLGNQSDRDRDFIDYPVAMRSAICVYVEGLGRGAVSAGGRLPRRKPLVIAGPAALGERAPVAYRQPAGSCRTPGRRRRHGAS
jgi:hypothetical protein